MKLSRYLVYGFGMGRLNRIPSELLVAASPSRRTLHVEMLRLCARIGYSPPRRL